MNIILGFVISLIVVICTMDNGIVSTSIDKVIPEAPAFEYIKAGDEIVEINDRSVHIYQDVATALALGEDPNTFDVKIKRNGETFEFRDIPHYTYEENGVKYKLIGITCATEDPSFFGVLHEGFFQTVYMGKMVFTSLSMLIHGDASVSDLSGPVGVIDQMSKTASASGGGFAGFIN